MTETSEKSSEPGKCTLFVGNLPTTATNEDLEKEFSEIGPIKRCFVVKEKRIGFVTYALREDAHSAIEKVKTLQGKALRLSFANGKAFAKPQKHDEEDNKSPVTKTANKVEKKYKAGNKEAKTVHKVEKKCKAGKSEVKTQKKRNSFGRMVIRNLADQVTEEDIGKVCEKYGKVIDVYLPKMPNGKLKGFGFVRMKNEQVTSDAIAGIHDQEILGRRVNVDWAVSQKKYKKIKSQKNIAEEDGKDPLNSSTGIEKNSPIKTMTAAAAAKNLITTDKKDTIKTVNKVEKQNKAGNNETKTKKKRKSFGKMILRNLSYKATEEDIRKVFEKFGKVIDVDIPKATGGKLKGFGFVRMENEQVTSDAIAGVNSQEILGRPVAVDWAISQKEYVRLKSEENAVKGVGKNSPIKTMTAAMKTKGKNKKSSANMDTYDLEEDSNDEESSQGGNDDDADDMMGSSDEDDDADDMMGSSDKDDAEEAMAASSDDEYNDASDQEKNSRGTGTKKNKTWGNAERYSDTKEGKTMFIRNISYNTTQEQLAEAFSKFGKLEYAIICVDPVTEHSKGSGFVKFANKESADECISKTVMPSEDGGITLDGHKLWVNIAISKDDTKKIDEDKTKKKKDNRNLYLAREGLIRPGTLAAEGVSQEDMKTRMHLEERKGRLLRNLHMFVSDNRLSVWNIPLSMTEKTLKGIFSKAGGSGAVLTEVRIMRSLKKFDASGIGQSKGFGFVKFKENEHALRALRATNNNPDIFTPSRRPIVEFTLENKAALKVKERRLENSQRRNKQVQESENPEKKSSKSDKREALRKTAPSSDITTKSSSFVGTKSESLDTTKAKTLPSHFGPKIRHKKRPGAEAAKALKNTKKIRKRKREEMLIAQTKLRNRKEMPPPKKIKQSEDNLDRLVSNYQKKVKSKNKKEGEKSKWFKKSN